MIDLPKYIGKRVRVSLKTGKTFLGEVYNATEWFLFLSTDSDSSSAEETIPVGQIGEIKLN